MTPSMRTFLVAIGAGLAVLYFVGWVVGSANDSNTAQVLAGLATSAVCGRTAWTSVGIERYWRALIGAGMVGWTIGQSIYAWHRLIAKEQLGSPSWADVGYLSLPVFAVFALAILVSDRAVDSEPLSAETVLRRTRASTVICALVISGTMFVVTWSTRGPDPVDGSVVVGIIYLISDVVVVVMTSLIATVWAVPAEFRLQLRVLAVALACIAVSDGVYAYLVSIGKDQFPPSDAGYVFGPFLVGVAVAFIPARRSEASHQVATSA